MKLYKMLDAEGRSCNGGEASWSLPTKGADGKWKPGEWMPEIEGKLELCKNGYHLCRPDNLLPWLGKQIFEAEHRGEKEERGDKIVVRQCRLLKRCEGWTEESARLFACWCIRNTLLNDGRKVWDLLKDKRSRTAVEVAEAYAKGKTTKEDLDAARDAARDAAEDAAEDATWTATWDAAWAAAWAAAEDAAGAVAWDAAWAAARAAEDAAWAVAWDGRDGRDARDVAKAAQYEELLSVINRKEDEKNTS
ncbi:MAG: hypothetical protein U9N61_00245 [Euryarchaeota archaeon]|nr:hypothetical protein [Euryarchaeota archaeon]